MFFTMISRLLTRQIFNLVLISFLFVCAGFTFFDALIEKNFVEKKERVFVYL